MGKDGGSYGIAVYEGYEAFNRLLMLTMQEAMNLSDEYVMYSQNSLTCYWGDREELTAKQRAIIKALGYKYRGKNNWLYFMSYEPGYDPYNMDQDEVVRMTKHLEHLETAFTYYKENGISIDFEEGNMFSAVYSEDSKTWQYDEEPLPFTCCNIGNLVITDELLLKRLSKVPKSIYTLEADVRPLGAAATDEEYDKPINPFLSILAEGNSGLIIASDMNGPAELLMQNRQNDE